MLDFEIYNVAGSSDGSKGEMCIGVTVTKLLTSTMKSVFL